MLEIARSADLTITEEIICHLHYLFYLGINPDVAGRYRTRQVFITGTDYVPPAAKDVPTCMADLVAELAMKQNKLHPVEFAAHAHRRLVDIHPFEDGNGRTARLLMNLILVNRGFCIVSIPPILRREYITALQQTHQGRNPSDKAFVKLIAECEIEAQKDYCRLFHIKLPK